MAGPFLKIPGDSEPGGKPSCLAGWQGVAGELLGAPEGGGGISQGSPPPSGRRVVRGGLDALSFNKPPERGARGHHGGGRGLEGAMPVGGGVGGRDYLKPNMTFAMLEPRARPRGGNGNIGALVEMGDVG